MNGQGRMWGGTNMMGGQRGNYNCPNYLGGGQSGWTTEQRQQYLDSTVALRKEMQNKRFELNEAQRNPKTTAEQLGTLEKELIDIRTQLNAKAQVLQPAAQ